MDLAEHGGFANIEETTNQENRTPAPLVEGECSYHCADSAPIHEAIFMHGSKRLQISFQLRTQHKGLFEWCVLNCSKLQWDALLTVFVPRPKK